MIKLSCNKYSFEFVTTVHGNFRLPWNFKKSKYASSTVHESTCFSRWGALFLWVPLPLKLGSFIFVSLLDSHVGVLYFRESPCLSRFGVLGFCETLASHVSGCLILASPLASHVMVLFFRDSPCLSRFGVFNFCESPLPLTLGCFICVTPRLLLFRVLDSCESRCLSRFGVL